MTFPRLNTLTLTATRIEHGTKTMTLAFERPSAMRYAAGQHGLWQIPGAGIHPYTFASPPDADQVELTTVMRESSPTKQTMRDLRPGSRVRVLAPLGGFGGAAHGSRLVLVSHGIGITPYASILRTPTGRPGEQPDTTLLQVGVPHLYDEIAPLATRATALAGREELRAALDDALATHAADSPTTTAADPTDDVAWLVSGASGFVKDVSRRLRRLAVPARRIHTDPFWGLRAATGRAVTT